MKHPFNKKRFWLIVCALALLEVLALYLILQWKYIFPSNEVSELYTKYANTEGVEASFVKDFRINDTVFVDVTMLEATTVSGWERLKCDFNIPIINKEYQERFRNTPVTFCLVPKNDYKASEDSIAINNDMITISRNTQTVCVFHITDENQINGIVTYNLNIF